MLKGGCVRSRQPFDFLTGRWRQRAFVLVLAAVGFDLHAAASVSVVEAADIHLRAYLQAEARQVERLWAYLRNETPSSCTERCDIPSLPGVAIERRLQEALAARGVAETPALTSRIGAITQAMTEGVRRSRCHALDASSAFFGAATPEEAGEAMVRFRCDLPDAAVALRHAATLREHGDSVSVDALLRTHLDAAMALLRAPLRTVDAEMLMHRDTGGGWRTMLPAQWMEYFLALLEHADAPATAVPAANLYLRAHLGFVAADRKKLDDYLRSSLDPARDEPGTTLADLLNSLDEETAWDENVAVVRLTGTFLPHREGGKLARLFEEIPQQRIQALSRQMVVAGKQAQCTAMQVEALPFEYSRHARVAVRCQLPDIAVAAGRFQQRADAGIPVTVKEVDALIAALASPARRDHDGSLELELIGARGDTWYVHPNKVFDMMLRMLFSPARDVP